MALKIIFGIMTIITFFTWLNWDNQYVETSFKNQKELENDIARWRKEKLRVLYIFMCVLLIFVISLFHL